VSCQGPKGSAFFLPLTVIVTIPLSPAFVLLFPTCREATPHLSLGSAALFRDTGAPSPSGHRCPFLDDRIQPLATCSKLRKATADQ
jgi:hypothetical protein